MTSVRVQKFARAHDVFKLWKNPNALHCDTRSCARLVCAAHGSAGVERNIAGALLKTARIL